MSAAAIGALVGLGFAFVWLLAGAAALPRAARGPVTVGGGVAVAAAALAAVHRPGGLVARFDGLIYGLSVAAEIAAIVAIVAWLRRRGVTGLVLPAVGVIVGLHFIGLWAATGARLFLGVAAGLVAVNLAALAAPRRGGWPQAVAGLGSAAVLVAAALA